MSNSKTKSTTDTTKIKEWSQAREGKPSVVESTYKSDKAGGLLRINFPDYQEDNLKEISWEEFFRIFKENNLQFQYQEETKDGSQSTFFKFENQE